MKNSTLAVVTLSVLITSTIIAFTLIIKELLYSEPYEAEVFSNEQEQREGKIAVPVAEPVEQVFPTINLGNGLSDMEFWTLYNYWNEKDGHGLPRVDITDKSVMEGIGSKKLNMGSGVYLSYRTPLQRGDELYAPISIEAEELENYDPDTLAEVFKVTVKITEGKGSDFYKDIYENSMDLIKGYEVYGDNYEWQIDISPYKVSFDGYPITEDTEYATYYDGTDVGVVDETEHNGYVDENQEDIASSIEENYLNEDDDADVSSDSIELTEPEQPKETSEKLYRIRAGVFSSEENALALENDIKNHGIEVAVVEKEGLYVVYVGAFKIKENADKRLAELESNGFEGYMKYE